MSRDAQLASLLRFALLCCHAPELEYGPWSWIPVHILDQPNICIRFAAAAPYPSLNEIQGL